MKSYTHPLTFNPLNTVLSWSTILQRQVKRKLCNSPSRYLPKTPRNKSARNTTWISNQHKTSEPFVRWRRNRGTFRTASW